ncbi:hypothetical protein [Carboxylicivirga marina]|uniref:hypothetical protein n=1 Tax=Carboxylicivirga marina TaxID=2800988 RepID=UPI002593D2A2|nr:hypothetical protein [uncultured Carboxylicivirga sp.]
MNAKGAIQEKLFKHIKEKLPTNLSLVHEVSEVLGISYDSAYRRLRNEKSLTLDEALLICNRFNCPLTSLIEESSQFLTFQHLRVGPEAFDKTQWLSFIHNRLITICQANEKQIVYAAKDPPIFQYFQFPEIVAFKIFFWEKTLFHSQKLEGKKLALNSITPDVVDKCRKISALSLQIPTIEIWNEDTFRILLRQIEYYWVSNYFESEQVLIELINSIETWLIHNQKQAELGLKFLYGHKPQGIENSYTLYENEIVLNDNTIYITEDNKCNAYITYNVLGLLGSSNSAFCSNVSSFHKVLISKSNVISQVGEKARNRFFNKLHQRIEQFRNEHGLSVPK